MKSARKAIKRASKESARKAIEKHTEKMAEKGWKVDQAFEGDAGCHYECITHYYK